MIERIFKNWKTTTGAIVISLVIGTLVYTGKIEINDPAALVSILAALGLFGAKDKKKTPQP